MATERPGGVTLNGAPLTLLGDPIEVGMKAPAYTLLSKETQPISSDDAAGKTRVLLPAGSFDTGVCQTEARTFQERVGELENVEVMFISMDLPPALARFCGAEGIDNITFASDHRTGDFGVAYGVLVKESRLFSRAAFVVNPAGEVTYAEYCPDILNEPDYDAVIEAAKAAAGQPA